MKKRKPFCYTVAVLLERKPDVIGAMPILWTKKAAADLARELTKKTGVRFLPAECHIRPKRRRP